MLLQNTTCSLGFLSRPFFGDFHLDLGFVYATVISVRT